MAGHRDHHSSKRSKLHVVIVPEGNGQKGLSFEAHRWQIAAVIIGVLFVVALGSIAAIVFTPLGRFVPVSETELAHRYGTELVTLQRRVINLSQEMLVMRDYNKKLRYALGDDTNTDSLMTDIEERLASASEGSAGARDQAGETSQPVPKPMSASQKNAGEENDAPEAQIAEHSPVFRAAFPISSPVEGYITRTFENEKMHFGVDYAGKRGTIVTAAADGYVIFSNWTHEDGNIIILSHGGGYVTVYQHNQSLLKQQGDFVKRGAPIALLGDSGTTSYGPHLHFELWKDGQPQNPGEYLIASGK